MDLPGSNLILYFVELLFEIGKIETTQKNRKMKFQECGRTNADQPPSFFLQIAKILPGLAGKIGDNLVIYQITMDHLSAVDMTVRVLTTHTTQILTIQFC